MFQKVREYFASIFDISSSGRLLIYSFLVGIVAGLGAAVFYYGLLKFQAAVLGDIVGYVPPRAGTEGIAQPTQLPTKWWLLLIVPTVGGLVTGAIVFTLAPEAEGHGTDALVKSFHRLRGKIRARIPFVKTAASIITIGTGGSAGREGPIAQIGAGFGSFLADKLRLSDRDRRLLMLAGAAGGIGAIFRAPLGGALFASEVLYGSTAIETAAVIPCFISSITAYTVFTQMFGTGLAINTPPGLNFGGAIELPFYLVFSIMCALVGYIYVLVFYGSRDRFFRLLPIPQILKPALGGLMLGVLAIWLPQVLASGYGWIQQAVDGKMTLGLMLLLCFGKIFATSFTISSGGSGGVFAPSLFIGAMLGGAFGLACEEFFPGTIKHPEAFVLVGMGGFFSGVARVPLTAMLMVCEMTGSYNLLIPLMLVCIINMAVLAPRWSLYEQQVFGLVDSPAHHGDFVIDVLEALHVRDVMDLTRRVDFIPENMPLTEVLRRVSFSANSCFPVTNEHQELAGIFSLRDLRAVLTGDQSGALIMAVDISTPTVITVKPDDDLNTALRRFTQKNIDYLPIVETDNPKKVIGMLSRHDVIAAYHARIGEIQRPD